MGINTDFMTAQTAGVTVTSGAASANAGIPTLAGGGLPKYVRIQATGFVYIKFGASGLTCTTSDVLISPNEAPVFNVAGAPFFAYIQQAAPVTLNIVPLES